MAKVKARVSRSAAITVIGPIADRAAYNAAQKMRGRAISNIRSSGRVDSGRMIAGLQVRVVSRAGLGVAYQVYSSAPYTVYQEFGTRGHGPRTANFMVFTPKGGGGVVFAKWVRGVTPALFMTRALQAARAADALQ